MIKEGGKKEGREREIYPRRLVRETVNKVDVDKPGQSCLTHTLLKPYLPFSFCSASGPQGPSALYELSHQMPVVI